MKDGDETSSLDEDGMDDSSNNVCDAAMFVVKLNRSNRVREIPSRFDSDELRTVASCDSDKVSRLVDSIVGKIFCESNDARTLGDVLNLYDLEIEKCSLNDTERCMLRSVWKNRVGEFLSKYGNCLSVEEPYDVANDCVVTCDDVNIDRSIFYVSLSRLVDACARTKSHFAVRFDGTEDGDSCASRRLTETLSSVSVDSRIFVTPSDVPRKFYMYTLSTDEVAGRIECDDVVSVVLHDDTCSNFMSGIADDDSLIVSNWINDDRTKGGDCDDFGSVRPLREAYKNTEDLRAAIVTAYVRCSVVEPRLFPTKKSQR